MRWMNRRALAIVALSLLGASGAVAGNLNPPPGPVAPTDRKILSQATTPLPLTISQPGSYVLTSDLIGVSGANGIVVDADNVVIDLNGFSIVGVPGAINGVVDLDIQHQGFVIMNGAVHSWPERALEITEFHGARCERLSIHNNGDGLIGGRFSVIIGCTARNNSGVGFWIPDGGMISQCAVETCGTGFYAGHGSTLTSCTATNCGRGFSFDFDCTFQACSAIYCGDGFYGESGSTFDACAAQKCFLGFRVYDRSSFSNCSSGFHSGDGYRIDGSGTILTGCSSSDNGGLGFFLGRGNSLINAVATRCQDGFYAEGEGNRFESCTADENRERGFFAAGAHTAIVNCNATRNGSPKGNSQGIYVTGESASVTGCHVTGNLGRGLWIAGQFSDVSANNCSDNSDDGLTIDSFNNRVLNNHCASNNASGIALFGWNNRVEGNSLAFNGTGLFTLGGENNLIIRNSATGNGTDYNVGANNAFAPVETPITILTATNPNSNFAH